MKKKIILDEPNPNYVFDTYFMVKGIVEVCQLHALISLNRGQK